MRWMRVTTKASFHDCIDLLDRGSTEDWQELYAEGKENPQVRALIEAALPFLDPDCGEAKVSWRFLLDSMPPPPPAPPSPPSEPGSSVRQVIRWIASRVM